MDLFERFQRRFGRFAVPGLMRYFSILYAAGFVISMTRPYLYYSYLALDPYAILHGQPWRLVTFLMDPVDTGNFLNIALGLLMIFVYYSMGNTLENVWGTFRFNVFMFSGVLFHILAAFLIYAVTGVSVAFTPGNLNLSIFLAFALTFPETRFYIYFVIPVKAKYLAYLYGFLEAVMFLFGGITSRITIGVSLFNLVLFFWWSGTLRRFSTKELKRKRDFRKAMAGDAGGPGKIVAIERAAAAGKKARHKCAVCGRTELDAPDLEFRYCSKCAGNHEYCSEHLYTHVHVTAEQEKTDSTQ